MKAIIIYILFLGSLFGAQQPVLASSHSVKDSHVAIKKLQIEQDFLVGIEDENDEDDIIKKFSSTAKWFSSLNNEFSLNSISSFATSFSPAPHSYSGCDIYLIQRVLRV